MGHICKIWKKICPTLRNSFIRKFYIKLQSWQTVLIVSNLLCFTFLFNLLCALVFILSMVRLLTNFLIDHVANWGGYIFTPLFIKRFTWFPMAFRFIGAIWSNLLCRDHLGWLPTFRCTIVRRTVEWIFCSSTSTSINRNKVRHSTLPTCGLCCHKYLQKKEISIVLLVRQKARRKSNGLTFDVSRSSVHFFPPSSPSLMPKSGLGIALTRVTVKTKKIPLNMKQ